MNKTLRLRSDGRREFRVVVSQTINGNAADHIEIFSSLGIVQITAASFYESNGQEIKYLKAVVYVIIPDKGEIIFYTHNALSSPLRS